MIRVVFFALATVVVAQQTTPNPGQTTGVNNIYRKIIQGSLSDPANFKSYIQLVQGNQPLSNWHDLPLIFDAQNKTYNMIVEIPRGEATLTLVGVLNVLKHGRMNLGLEMNPITVVLGDNNQPKTENVDYIHNFGKFPQTYNNASIEDQLAKLPGNGKPLDVVEISERTHRIGDIVQVKILGVLAVVDNNQIDWKVIAFDINSARAADINSLSDVDNLFPDLLQATRGYFRFYRFPIQINDMLFNGAFQDADTAHSVIADKNAQWQDLIELETPPNGINTESHQSDGFFKADDAAWLKILNA